MEPIEARRKKPVPCSPQNCGDTYSLCGKTSTYDNGRRCRCEACCAAKREYNRRYREANRERVTQYNSTYNRVNAEVFKEYRRSHREENGDEIRERDRQRYAENREVVRERARRSWAENREAIAETRRQQYAENREAFREHNRRHYAANREARAEYARRYRAENPEKVADANRRHYVENLEAYLEANRRRRARQVAATTVPFTAEQLAQRFAYYGNRCYLRLNGCTGGADQVEHVKPLSKGGAHMLCNLRPACGPCNSRKHDKWPFTSRS